jgi:tetratricopeptide (TPR) repeat protein/DNA-binding winged helix-turn-helix (wHTH) protein
MSSEIKHLYEFGPYRIDSQKRILLRGGEPVPLTPKAFDTLLVLVEKQGRVVLKDDLMKTLWPDSFVEESNLSQNIFTLRKALGDSGQERRYILTIPGRGYQFVETVREVGQEQSEELVVESHSRSRVVIEESQTRSALFWGGVALVVALIAGAGGYLYRAGRTNSHAREADFAMAGPAVKLRPSVAVMGFRNLSRGSDEAWLSTALSEMLNTELAAGERLRMVPGEQISRAKLDLALMDTESLAKESLARLRARLGADYVVLGSYTALGTPGKGRIRLDLRLQDTQAGETIAEEAVTGSQEELFDLVSEAGSRLRQRLQAGTLVGEQAVQVRASLPSNTKAARLYAEGLAKLRLFETLAARDLLQQAVAADPKFPPSHSALASAWWALGYESKAQDEARRAMDLSAGLAREDRLFVEAQYRERTREWPQAIAIYQTLRESFPDNLEYGLRLAGAQSASGSPKDAVSTLAVLRKLPGGLGQDPRIDLAEAKAAEFMGDFKREQQLAATAAEKGRLRDARLLVAQARLVEGTAFERSGDPQRATAALQEAHEAFTRSGDLQSAAAALLSTGNVLTGLGDLEGARKQDEEALSVFQRIGSKRVAARALNNLGNIFYYQGHLKEAQARYQQALAIDREIGYKNAVAGDLGNLANVLDNMGHLAEARPLQEQALQAFSDAGDKRGTASTLGNLGNLLDELGDLEAAVHYYEQAHKLHQEIGYKRGVGFVLTGWGQVLIEQDRLDEARVKLQEAIAIRKELADQLNLGISSLGLAQILLEEDHAADGEKLARDAAQQFISAKSVENEALANVTLARALLAQQKLPEARSAADRALELSRKTTYLPPHFEAVIIAARVLAASGKPADARKQLEALVIEARKFGFAGYEFSARFELGRIEIQSGQTAAGTARLQTLQKDAAAKGFRLIARKAAGG